MKNSFLKRQFKIDTNKISNTLVAKLLLDMNLENFNMDTTNYLYDMYKNISDKTYCDDIDDIDDNDDNDNIKFSKNDINHLFDNLNEEQQADVEKLLERLEEDDDVQNVYHSMEM